MSQSSSTYAAKTRPVSAPKLCSSRPTAHVETMRTESAMPPPFHRTRRLRRDNPPMNSNVTNDESIIDLEKIEGPHLVQLTPIGKVRCYILLFHHTFYIGIFKFDFLSQSYVSYVQRPRPFVRYISEVKLSPDEIDQLRQEVGFALILMSAP